MDRWRTNIYNEIKGFSDLNVQRTLWTEGDPSRLSSFNEDFSQLLDSLALDDFLVEANWTGLNLNDQLRQEIFEFKVLLESYQRKDRDVEILADPEWHKVVKKAKKVIDLWGNDSALD